MTDGHAEHRVRMPADPPGLEHEMLAHFGADLMLHLALPLTGGH